MQIRLYKAGEGAFVVVVKHARVLRLRSCVRQCKNKAEVVAVVQGEVQLEADVLKLI